MLVYKSTCRCQWACLWMSTCLSASIYKAYHWAFMPFLLGKPLGNFSSLCWHQQWGQGRPSESTINQQTWSSTPINTIPGSSGNGAKSLRVEPDLPRVKLGSRAVKTPKDKTIRDCDRLAAYCLCKEHVLKLTWIPSWFSAWSLHPMMPTRKVSTSLD